MDMSSYFRLAVYFCLIMIIFTFSINFVDILEIFPSVEGGLNETEDDILTTVSGLRGGWGAVWALIIGVGAVTALGFAKIMGNTNIIGIYLFSSIFWTSYSRCLAVVHIGNYVSTEFLLIFTVALAFIWVASIISMLTSVS